MCAQGSPCVCMRQPQCEHKAVPVCVGDSPIVCTRQPWCVHKAALVRDSLEQGHREK